MDKMTTGSMGQSPDEVNSVDELNRKYREEAEKAAKKDDGQPGPNPIDELNREYQDGEPTGAAQTEATEVPGGLESKE